MRIVDVCAFYSPAGGGVRTYIEAKLKAAPGLGHEMIVIAPGERHEIIRRGPGAVIATIPSPTLPLDRRYRYFDDERALHQALDAWCPDHIEASSPWSSATMVGRWQGSATRSLVMHSDPLAAYAYRWLGRIAPIATIDRWFGRFWRHLRGLDQVFDLVVSADDRLTRRLRSQALEKAETVRLGVEPGLFSPQLRSAELRRAALALLGLSESSTLLIGIGRLSPEKRWDMVVRAVDSCAGTMDVGLLLVGDGPQRQRLEALARRLPTARLIPPIADRAELARLLASADGLVHGCEAETFCMVAAEARASGIPLIVPDRGAAAGHLVQGAGATYRWGREHSLGNAIHRFIASGPELQRARAAHHSDVRTMTEHFAELFERYESLTPWQRTAKLADSSATAFGVVPALR
jgi:alpha-1,6-mannosyltransferase